MYKMEVNNTIMDYYSKVLKFILIIFPVSAFIAAVLFPVMKFFGFYSSLNNTAMMVFTIIVIIESVVVWYSIKLLYTNGKLNINISKLNVIKQIMLIILYVNYTYLALMVPSKELWVCVFYFLILSALFLDLKMLLQSIVMSLISIVIVSLLNAASLPDKSVIVEELIMRSVDISLVFFGILAITYFASKVLVDSCREESEKHDSRIKKIFSNSISTSEEINNYSSFLSETINSTVQALDEIDKSVAELTSGSRIQADNAQRGARELGNLASRIDVVFENSSKIKEFIENIKEANTAGSNQMDIMENVIIENIKVISEAIKRVSILEGKIKLIDGITEAIISIAEQTNLLALNAKIEGARAGEHGKGFMIVAGEVGKLSEKVNERVKAIETNVNDVKMGIHETREQMDSAKLTTDRANEASGYTRKGMEVINKSITSMIEKIEDLIDNIVSVNSSKNNVIDSIQEISAISEQSSASMENMSMSLHEQVNIMQQIDDTSNKLNNISEQLKVLIKEEV